jgi:hypothetical protein
LLCKLKWKLLYLTMSPLISRATDNLGLIFSLQLGGGGGAGGGPVPVQDFFYDIELFGEGFVNAAPVSEDRYGPGGSGVTPGRLNLQSNLGGYTKLRMKSLTSSEISFEPQLYLGGRILTSKNTNGSISSVEKSAAGDAAAFSIDGEWMGIAGGGSLSYYVSENFTTGTPTGSIFTDTVRDIVECTGNILDGGQGGVNFFNPSAIPQSGPDISDVPSEFFTQSGTGTVDFTNKGLTVNGGAGGAGAGPGVSRDLATLTPSTGGAGNIRIWADTAGVDGISAGVNLGDISSVPGTTMELVDDRDGTEIGESRVAITATNTGLGITYTTNNTLSLRELKALLDPELEFAFDVELYGEGIGQDNTITSVTNQVGGVPPATVVSNNSGRGGYTKLRMIVPSSASQISFEPNKYAGGISTTTRTEFVIGTPVVNSFEFGKGGDAAAFSIDGEWMGIAGGSGQVYYKVNTNIITTTSSITETSTIISSPSVFGRGGVNATTPTASPEGGQGKLNTGVVNLSGTLQQALDYRGGSGGGGAGPGLAYAGPDDGPATTVPSGGAGNIRVYEQTNPPVDTGDIFLPGIDPIYMRLEDSRDNFWLGASKVVVSHPVTGASLEFTSDTTISIRELRALLIPTQEIAFEIELFGAGLGIIPRTSGGAIFGPSDTTTSTDVNYLAGGYTKLKMFVPISDPGTISFEPALYLGGRPDPGSTSFTGNVPRGRNAAAFSINGEWMGIAGGGGDARYTVRSTGTTQRDAPPPAGTGAIIFESESITSFSFNDATVPGKGGVNVGNPTASPENGGDYRYTGFRNSSGTSANETIQIGGSRGGGGGGGALGGIGRGASPVGPGDGGEGNIRIYAETNGAQTKGDLTSVPGVYMELLNSADDFWVGSSKVVIKNILNGDISTFNRNQTFTKKELREIFYPGVFPPA